MAMNLFQNVKSPYSMKPRRKAMVTAIWKREFSPKSIRLDHSKPEEFVRCQVSITFLRFCKLL